MSRPIHLVEARTNNLKNVSCEIPRGKLVLVTGPSGSGKSSLVLGTLLAEAERRIAAPLGGRILPLSSKSSRATAVSGLSFPVAFYSGRGRISRIATVLSASGLGTVLEELYFRTGIRHCLNCDAALPALSLKRLLDELGQGAASGTVRVLALLPADERQRDEAVRVALSAGYTRAVAGDTPVELERLLSTASLWKDDQCYVFIDAVLLGSGSWKERARGAALLAEKLGGATFQIVAGDNPVRELFYSESPRCASCGTRQEPLARESYSYARRAGRCSACLGAGVFLAFDTRRLVDGSVPLFDGGIRPWRRRTDRPPERDCRQWADALSVGAGAKWSDLEEKQQTQLLFGTSGVNRYTVFGPVATGPLDCLVRAGLCGYLLNCTRTRGRKFPAELITERECTQCGGSRLRPEAAATTVDGINFREAMHMPLGELLDWRPHEPRLRLLCDFGLSYLSLGRAVRSLSSGELQRVELARELGSTGRGLLYLLDEPSAGLHPRDLSRVLEESRKLSREDSALIVTDHHEQVVAAAEHVIALGPAGGVRGGELMFAGSAEEFRRTDLGGGEREYARRPADTTGRPRISASGVSTRNLKNISLRIPVRSIVGVCGVSGSGKSTALFESLGPAVREIVTRPRRSDAASVDLTAYGIGALDLPEQIRRVEMLDRIRLGARLRTDVGSMLGIWPVLARLFAMAPEARLRGLTAESFGRRAGSDVADFLDITWRGKKFRQVMQSTVEELAELFNRVPRVAEPLRQLVELNLGYLNISQPAGSLSTGERQRLRLAARLSRRFGGTLFLLDEPARGLDAGEVLSLLRLFERLVEEGNSVVFIEHRPLLLAHADYLIELGPGAGDNGGQIIAEGAPREIAKNPRSLMASYLEGGS